jgi:DNA helicase-2/ATP-dependent DNA helicase PcrA
MSYLDSLNEPQREAVLNTEGPMMIIAGAGSGKTRVLTYRIAYLIEREVEPFNILALTFTNKAAREMRNRIESVVGSEAKNLWMGTFHSIFARILRYEADKLGYQSNFTIYDTDDSKSLLRGIIKELKLDDKLYKVNGVLNRISLAKNNLVSAEAYAAEPQYIIEDEACNRPKLAEIYKQYAARSFKANAMDFDDLLFNMHKLFKNHLDALNKYQHRFKYVMIDEFQDTNLAQYSIVKKLSALHQNICVVGDDAQSIYAFRGANIQNILNFERDYPELRVIKLEQNYRSTQHIVSAANSLIKHNRGQLPKKVWTSNGSGDKVDLIKATTDSEEARLLATTIFEQKMQHSLTNNDFAILYRTNAQSRSLEEALRKLNLPYRIIGGISFYQRKEVKDLLSYMRFAINTNDAEAFKRIVNLPKRGIGATTVNKVLVASYEQEAPLWDVLTNLRERVKGLRNAKLLEEFVYLIKTFKGQVKSTDAYTAANYIAKNSGLLKELYDDKTIEGRVRYDNLQELLNAIKAFVDNEETADKSLDAFLQDVALMTNADDQKAADAITLMTIHMSKGLEYKQVYVAGLEENLFPSQMMLESREDLEEERRLFYVAITRAEQKLTLSYALQRYRFGQTIMCEPSRFLNDIDTSYLNVLPTTSLFDQMPTGSTPGAAGAGSRKLRSNFAPVRAAGPKHQVSTNFEAALPAELKQGMRVEHSKFGFGKILKIEEFASDKRAKIAFERFGEKTLILSFAKLMIHPEE